MKIHRLAPQSVVLKVIPSQFTRTFDPHLVIQFEHLFHPSIRRLARYSSPPESCVNLHLQEHSHPLVVGIALSIRPG